MSAAWLQRRIFRARFAWLAEATFTERLSLRCRALAFHLWQPRAENEWNHPHDKHFPEDLADRFHHIHRAESSNRSRSSMLMSRTGFTRTTIFVKTASKRFGYPSRLHGTVNQRFREVLFYSRQVAFRRIDLTIRQSFAGRWLPSSRARMLAPKAAARTASQRASAVNHDFLGSCGRSLGIAV